MGKTFAMAVSFSIQGQWIFTSDPSYINQLQPVNLNQVSDITSEKREVEGVVYHIINFYLNTATTSSSEKRQNVVEWKFTDVTIVDDFFTQFAAKISLDGIGWKIPPYSIRGQWIFTSDVGYIDKLVPVNLDNVTHIEKQTQKVDGVVYYCVSFKLNTSTVSGLEKRQQEVEWRFTDQTIRDNFFTQFAAQIAIDGILWTSPTPPGGSGWKLDGNTEGALKYIGTNDAFDLPFYSNGAEVMRITTAGYLLINATVASGVSSLVDIASAGNTSATRSIHVTNTSSKVLMTLYDNGVFQLYDSLYNFSNSGQVTFGSADGNGQLTLRNTSSVDCANLQVLGTSLLFDTNDLFFRTIGGTVQMFKESSTGNIAIGTGFTSPSQKLHIKEGKVLIDSDAASSYTGMKYLMEVGGGSWGVGFNSSLNAMLFLTTGSFSGVFMWGSGSVYSPSQTMTLEQGQANGYLWKLDFDAATSYVTGGKSGTTTDATLTTIHTIPIPTDTSYLMTVEILGKKTGGAGLGTVNSSVAFMIIARVENVGGTVTVGIPDAAYTDNLNFPTFLAQISASGSNLLVQVQGDTNQNVTWTYTERSTRL